MESKQDDSDSDTEDKPSSSDSKPLSHDLLESTSSKLCDHLYMDDDLSDAIESHVESTADAFKDAEPTDGSEYSLQHHGMYKEYAKMVEDNLEGFAETMGFSPRELIESLAEAAGESSDISSGENIATAISALTSFEEYVRMMRSFINDGISPCVCPPLLNEDGELEYT